MRLFPPQPNLCIERMLKPAEGTDLQKTLPGYAFRHATQRCHMPGIAPCAGYGPFFGVDI
jgi:hypothetical protein